MVWTRQRWMACTMMVGFLVYAEVHFQKHLNQATLSRLTASLQEAAKSSLKPPNYAFATFLTAKYPDQPELEAQDINEDLYFESVRVMAYQLLHSPSARSTSAIPFVVLVTSEVAEAKKARLTADGAVVVVVEHVMSTWAKSGVDRWRDCLTKLRLLELVQFDKVCYIDADHLITKPLDGVFADPAAAEQVVLEHAATTTPDEAPLPSTYVFAARPEVGNYVHNNPPDEIDYFNAGFLVLKPDSMLASYYAELMLPTHAGLLDAAFLEQDLMNYAHRREGKMPWRSLWQGWNRNFPNEQDWRSGVHSFHDKFWNEAESDPVLRSIWQTQRVELAQYWKGQEAGV